MVLYEIITRTPVYEGAAVPPSVLPTLILMGMARPHLETVDKVLESLEPDSVDFVICQLLKNIAVRCWEEKLENRPSCEEGLPLKLFITMYFC